ncbi:MAG: dienelactone hydrolase family protein [Gemmatimonadaceae bacterium]
MPLARGPIWSLCAAFALAACAQRQTVPAADSHAGHDMGASATAANSAAAPSSDTSLPADAESATARLAASPRHGEWVTIPVGGGDSVRAWVVYPERSTKAPVVLVIHEIFGLTTWVRAVADQLAAEGFIAIAPDFLTGKRLPMAPDAFLTAPGGVDSARVLISSLDPAQFVRRVDAAARYGTSLPAATDKWGVVGFCWGGSMTYLTAASFPTLSAAVPYYGGVNPKQIDLTKTKAAVLGLYGGNDARVNMTIPTADSALRIAGATFDKQIFPGAGHGFLRQQSGQDGANAAATRAAWPRTVEWFRKYLGA